LTLGLEEDLQGLKLVHVVFRHGDRNPIDMYPNDPYKSSDFWPDGFGQLTGRGKQRHFKLGQWIRKRYAGFLSDDYDHDEVHVRSTDVDRTLMSAESNLAGLYPPTDTQRWNRQLAWQPIPVHTVPQSEDDLLSSHAACPRFDQLQAELLASQNFTDIYEENRDLFEYVTANTGQNITDIVNLDYIYDTLLIEANNNLTLPDWTQPIFPGGKFKELVDLSFIVDTYTPELKRLKGGPFLKNLIENCEKSAKGELTPENRKLFMFSGHDTTVAPILHTLDLFNPPVAPPYAAMIIFELFLRDTPVIRISYKNESNSEPYVLQVPGCDLLCPLDTFRELLTPMLPTDWRAECGFEESNRDLLGEESSITLIAALASSVMCVFVLIAVCVLLLRPDKSNQFRYNNIPQIDA